SLSLWGRGAARGWLVAGTAIPGGLLAAYLLEQWHISNGVLQTAVAIGCAVASVVVVNTVLSLCTLPYFWLTGSLAERVQRNPRVEKLLAILLGILLGLIGIAYYLCA